MICLMDYPQEEYSMNELIKIELNEEDASLFRQFRENQDTFKTFIKNGVFNIRNGTALLNFDNLGNLTQIDINVVMYKKGYPNVVIITNV